MSNPLINSLNGGRDNKTIKSVHYRIWDKIAWNVRDQVWHQIQEDVFDQVENQVGEQIKNRVYEQIWFKIAVSKEDE